MKFDRIIKTALVLAVLFTVAFANINPAIAETEKDLVLEKYLKTGTLYSGRLDSISTAMLYFQDFGFALSKDTKFFSKYGDKIGAEHFKANSTVDFVVGSDMKVVMVKKR